MINNMIKECDISGESPEAPPPNYGVDYGGPLPDDQLGTVNIPETLCPLEDEEIDQFIDHVDTTSNF